jgi:hypothetical protein
MEKRLSSSSDEDTIRLAVRDGTTYSMRTAAVGKNCGLGIASEVIPAVRRGACEIEAESFAGRAKASQYPGTLDSRKLRSPCCLRAIEGVILDISPFSADHKKIG